MKELAKFYNLVQSELPNLSGNQAEALESLYHQFLKGQPAPLVSFEGEVESCEVGVIDFNRVQDQRSPHRKSRFVDHEYKLTPGQRVRVTVEGLE